MSTELSPSKLQSRLTDDFFYFFLRLRKDRIRKVVANINARFPEESVEQRARRLIEDQTQLSILGGLILDLPTMIPGVGQALKILGFVGWRFGAGPSPSSARRGTAGGRRRNL